MKTLRPSRFYRGNDKWISRWSTHILPVKKYYILNIITDCKPNFLDNSITY